MNNDIKEILKELKQHTWLEYEEMDKLLDYITNLQEKVNQYENPDDMTLMFMWCDEKAKDKMKQLQEENKRLQDRNIELVLERDRLKELCDKYEEEHSTTFEYWKRLVKEDYKSRNEKAIECIKNFLCTEEYIKVDGIAIANNYIELLNILEGEDKDE